MKLVKMMMVTILLAIMGATNAQSEESSGIITVFNHADWCHVCRKHEARALDVLKKASMNIKMELVVNDITNEDTKEVSKVELKKLGIEAVISKKKHSGMIYFVNPVSKKIVGQISASKSNEAIEKALKAAISK